MRGPDDRRTGYLTAILVASLFLLSALAYYQGVTVGAQLSPNLVAKSVSGSVNINSPGQEAFWSQVTGVQVPLTTTNDYGGATKSATLKMANNGTHILVYATWTDPTQSKIKNNVIEDESYPALFYANSTFAYEDRIVLWWSLDQNPGPPPCMQKSDYGHGEGESLAGTGNLWHWKAARTDSSGASFGKLKFGSGPYQGQTLVPPHSYADNEFINTSGHYQLGWDQYPTATSPGNFTVGWDNNHVPYNTFLVSAHGVYDSATHTYSWVAARSLSTSPSQRTVQFAPEKTYYFAVAVFDGGPIPIPSTVAHPAGWTSYGENEETKSISSWFTMALGSPIGGTTQTVTTATGAVSGGGVAFETAAIVSFATLIVGFVAGVTLILKFAAPKNQHGAESSG